MEDWARRAVEYPDYGRPAGAGRGRPAEPDPSGPSGLHRVGIAVLALGVFVAGAIGAWQLLRPDRSAVRAPAGGDSEMSQRVYGDTLCAWQSTTRGKLDLTAGADTTSDPVGACQAVWAPGSQSEAPAPEMIACVEPDMPGHVAVVEMSTSPDGTCAALGWSPLPDGWDENLAEWRATEDAASSVFPGRSNGISCQRDERTAVNAWRNALEEHGFTSWPVTVDGDNAGRPCFNYAVDFDAMTVTIVHDTVS